MKKRLLFIILISSFFIVSCQSGENSAPKESKTENLSDQRGDKTAIVSSDTSAERPHPEDPHVTSATVPKDPTRVDIVRARLRELFMEDLQKGFIDSFSRYFAIDTIDLNGDQQEEIFVGLRGSYFCGSGGCTILLLDPAGKLITKFTVSQPPVSVSSTLTKGWRDLLLYSRGSYRLLKFNGKTYPFNPSVVSKYTGTIPTAWQKELDYDGEAYTWFEF